MHFVASNILEIVEQFQNLIYQKEITSLTMDSFDDAFNQLDHLLPSRLAQIQEYCQSLEELEMERIHTVWFYYLSKNNQYYVILL